MQIIKDSLGRGKQIWERQQRSGIFPFPRIIPVFKPTIPCKIAALGNLGKQENFNILCKTPHGNLGKQELFNILYKTPRKDPKFPVPPWNGRISGILPPQWLKIELRFLDFTFPGFHPVGNTFSMCAHGYP